MRLDLREIIEIPGARKSFECTLDTAGLGFPSVVGFVSPPYARGEVINSAGALTLQGELTADMTVICDRCCEVFPFTKKIALSVPLSAELIDEDSPDIFPIHGDCADLTEILFACFVLEMDSKLLCSAACRGLCEACGANLNRGNCGCRRNNDPRLAVLEQLLDID